MGLLRLAATGAVGYVLYKAFKRQTGDQSPVAFAAGDAPGDNFSQVRSAGTEGMRSNPPGWDKHDQAMDESFPASDPPGTY